MTSGRAHLVVALPEPNVDRLSTRRSEARQELRHLALNAGQIRGDFRYKDEFKVSTERR